MKIAVRLIPNASRDEIQGRMADGSYKIRVQSPPVDGKANKRLVAFLAATCGVSKSSVRILRGETSRRKIVEIDGGNANIENLLKGDT